MGVIASDTSYDAIVVGSGISGGWAAKELCERGLRTLVLEAGGPVDAGDFVEHVQPYDMPFRGIGDQRGASQDQPVQSQSSGYDELSRKFFVNDRENPYTHPDDAPFTWIRGRQVGARCIAGATSTSLRMRVTVMALIGRFAMPTSRPGTRTSSASWACLARPRACRSCRMENSCRHSH